MRLRPIPVFTLFLLVLPLAAQEKPATSTDTMVRKALSGQQRVVTLLEKYSYTKHVVAEITDLKGKVTAHDERVASFAPCGGKVCSTLISVNGAPPKPKEIKQHEKAVQKEQEKQAKKSVADKQKEEDEDLFLSRDFLAVYDFSDAGTDVYRGTAVRVVAFKPKEQKVEVADKDNKVLSKMAGRLWIAEVDQQIVASEMHMVKPIKVWGGFAGAINDMTVQQEYIVDDGMYLPRKNTVEMEVRIMFSKGRWKIMEEYSDFKAPAPVVAVN